MAMELRKFLGITIMMGVVRLSNRSQYWKCRLSGGDHSQSFRCYCQIKCYIHISMPSVPSSPQNHGLEYPWWKKLEPLHSYLRAQSQLYFRPGTHVAIDEMMVKFSGRSKHTVQIPSKPIPVGYKVIALCYDGYTIDWMLFSRIKSFAELVQDPDLSPTSSAVMQ
ncbi:hypothetical protein L873DRAFT_1783116, partial [Choiromyces venosus 120613-1]